MQIYHRFREIRKILKMTQTEFGKQLGKTMRAIQNYESGERNINNDIIMILNEKFNINIHWLYTGTGSMFLTDTKREPSNVKDIDVSSLGNQFIEIKEFPTVKASAGYGAVICEAESVPYQIHKKFVENADKEIIIGVIGDSMQPELYEKDKVLITTDFKYTSNPKKNSLYVIGIGDEVYVKRYKQKRNNELIFSSDNKKYDDIKLNVNDGSIRIIGKLKLVIREYN